MTTGLKAMQRFMPVSHAKMVTAYKLQSIKYKLIMMPPGIKQIEKQ